MKIFILSMLVFNFNVEILRVYSPDYLAVKEVKIKKQEKPKNYYSVCFGRRQ